MAAEPSGPGAWIVRNWLMLSECVMLVILATLCWLLFHPALDTA